MATLLAIAVLLLVLFHAKLRVCNLTVSSSEHHLVCLSVGRSLDNCMLHNIVFIITCINIVVIFYIYTHIHPNICTNIHTLLLNTSPSFYIRVQMYEPVCLYKLIVFLLLLFVFGIDTFKCVYATILIVVCCLHLFVHIHTYIRLLVYVRVVAYIKTTIHSSTLPCFTSYYECV